MIPPLNPLLVAGGKFLRYDHLYSIRRRSGFIANFIATGFGCHNQIKWGLESD